MVTEDQQHFDFFSDDNDEEFALFAQFKLIKVHIDDRTALQSTAKQSTTEIISQKCVKTTVFTFQNI